MKKIILLSLVLLSLIGSTIFAETELTISKTKKHHVGLRLGSWSNNGGSIPSSIVDTVSNDSIVASIQDVNFYIEGFYAYNFHSSFISEISFGMVNRGNIQLYSAGLYDFSNIIIYPMLLQLKFYPLLTSHSKFQPFVGAGGGFYFAKQNIQFSNDFFINYYQVQGASKTDINYTLSGGFDWKIRDNFAIELQTKYMPIHFSDYFIGEKDYSATTITIGFKYKYNNIKK